MSLPLIAPPIRREEHAADRRLAARQPAARADERYAARVRCSRSTSRAARSDRRAADGAPRRRDASRAAPRRLPVAAGDDGARIALLSSANTDESARRHADMTIRGARLGRRAARVPPDRRRRARPDAAPRWPRSRTRPTGCSRRRAVRRRARRAGARSCGSEPARSGRFDQEAVPGLDRPVAVIDEVASPRTLSVDDADQRSFAEILGQPAGA